MDWPSPRKPLETIEKRMNIKRRHSYTGSDMFERTRRMLCVHYGRQESTLAKSTTAELCFLII